MFSKRNSNILKNDPNSMFDIGQKLSHTSIRNISIDNPSENPNMQLALNKINALPTIAPTTLNKFAITKSNNIQKKIQTQPKYSKKHRFQKIFQIPLNPVKSNIQKHYHSRICLFWCY